MEIKETLERIIREEVSQEFNIPMICPPVNRVEDNICDRFLSKIQDEEMPQRKPELAAMINKMTCSQCGQNYHSEDVGYNLCHDLWLAYHLAYHLRKVGESGLKISCDKCGNIIIEQGALLFSPPDENKKCDKRHICINCAQAITKAING